MKFKNPIIAIWKSEAHRGLKLIAYSLLMVFATAAPLVLYTIVSPPGSQSMALSLFFASGALVAHVGFIVGLCLLLWDYYFKK